MWVEIRFVTEPRCTLDVHVILILFLCHFRPALLRELHDGAMSLEIDAVSVDSADSWNRLAFPEHKPHDRRSLARRVAENIPATEADLREYPDSEDSGPTGWAANHGPQSAFGESKGEGPSEG